MPKLEDLLVFLRLDEVHKVIHRMPDVSRDVQVHQREAQALPATILALMTVFF